MVVYAGRDSRDAPCRSVGVIRASYHEYLQISTWIPQERMECADKDMAL